MKLSRVQIKNFRSIKYLEISFTEDFKILVGKNESGKSNILKALSLLDPEMSLLTDDLREPLPNEGSYSEAYVRFIFKLEPQELSSLIKEFENLFYTKEKSVNIIKRGATEYNVSSFISNHSEAIYTVDLLTSKRVYQYWSLADGYKIMDDLKTPLKFERTEGQAKKEPKNYLLLNASDLSEEIKKQLINANANIIHSWVGEKLTDLIQKHHPKVTYWKYDADNLLPANILITEFIENPDTCIPLKNLFLLAGIKNVKLEVEKAQKGSATKLRNLLERVSDHATKHFREIWKEYKSVSFSLSPNGTNIDAGVKERNTYTFEQRSDGFKRFMSFLLILSIDNKNNFLNKQVILVDEPDISLHPSGIRYLRDELNKISKNNIVVTSTHSIFMIDENCIERHYIVKKDDEETLVETPNEDNIIDEEVIYKALGYSAYELINKSNLIFEGWRDKKLFKTALERVPSNYKEIKEKYKNIGISHSLGVKGVRNTVQIFELVKRQLIIISDNDSAAKEKQKEFKKEKFYGDWYTYGDVDPKFRQITGEDFLKMDFVKKTITEFKKTDNEIENLPDYENIPKGILYNIDQWLISNKINGDQKKEKINEIKDLFFETVKSSDIIEEYYEMLLKLSAYIQE